LRAGIEDDKLAALILAVRDDDRLCIIHDDERTHEPQLICWRGAPVAVSGSGNHQYPNRSGSLYFRAPLMTLDATRARQFLKAFDFTALFLDELGWDRQRGTLSVTVDERSVVLEAIAHKRGMMAYLCPASAGERLPDYATRRRIEQQVTRSTHEHFIIFIDAERTTQIWQWVKREPDKPTACREHRFDLQQAGDALIQKLDAIAFTLDEEERLTLMQVTSRARAGFDVERVTKRFYEQFQKEHAAFLKFIAGIPESADREWYASAMLNRLMFVYFMQRKGFLDGDRDYLRNRLQQCQREQGQDRFYSFYRYFLLRLFHEGLGGKNRTRELETLLGRIPYLNGGLFEQHPLEERYPEIQIPDQAFENIFNYFDRYQWQLDERPLRKDNEINPDVLGYIFEKYINQKQMGAYYTKEDITEYIGKNTILPFLFDAAHPKCKIAFENAEGPTVWDLLRADPDRYIYPAVRHGIDRVLLPDIAAGLDTTQPDLLERRQGWNKPAPADYALPTEIWREVVARRTRCEAIRAKLTAGEVRDINDLITLNLNIRQFAQDVIENCEGPELLRALWKVIGKVTVLDPTCGSGAFLFAALNILEPLYEACLERMEAFVVDLDRSGAKHRPEKFSDFRQVLERVDTHPNRRYFILKSIILNNLFGVDIMEEATEICKLRLFLKLAAQVEPDPARENLGIEPLPDIDFNIRTGNTLVGYATYEEVRKAVGGQLDFDNAMEKIEIKAADLQQTFDAFRQRQIEGDGSVPVEHKLELRKRLKALEEELNRYLAVQYGKNPNNQQWLKSHQPFHWFVEFYGIMKSGGFDVIIGNPPYVELSTITKKYRPKNFITEQCGNLYALCTERSFTLQNNNSRFGFIVQQPITSTIRMTLCRQIISKYSSFIWASTYDDRPSKLFDGMHHARLAIIITKRNSLKLLTTFESSCLYVTRYNKWFKEERDYVFHKLDFIRSTTDKLLDIFPKFSTDKEIQIIDKLFKCPDKLGSWTTNNNPTYQLYYKITGVGNWFTITPRPPKFFRSGEESSSTRENQIAFFSEKVRDLAFCIFNSTLFYWFYQIRTNCRDFNPSDYKTFPVPNPNFLAEENMSFLADQLRKRLDESTEIIAASHSITGAIKYEKFRPKTAKFIIDQIDTALAKHYDFTTEELDFIINYDIKYRMGRDAGSEEE